MLGWIISALLAGATPAALAPSSPWDIEYAPDMCVMSRAFGHDPDSVTIGFRPTPMGSLMEVVVAWPGHGTTTFDGKATIQIDGGNAIDASYTRWTLPNKKDQIATLSIPDGDALAGLDKASSLSVAFANGPSWTVQLTSFTKAKTALKTCDDDLMKSWGLDSSEPARLSQPPKGNPARLNWPDNYPPDALRAGAQGKVITVLTIATDGRISDCRIALSSKNKSLDAATCRTARQMRYTPALDLAGNPAVAHVILPVRWVIPGQ